VGSCEHSNETLDFVKGREFLDWLSDLLVSQEGLCSMELVDKLGITEKSCCLLNIT